MDRCCPCACAHPWRARGQDKCGHGHPQLDESECVACSNFKPLHAYYERPPADRFSEDACEWECYPGERPADETCPLSTGRGTRRVQLVREGGRGGGGGVLPG